MKVTQERMDKKKKQFLEEFKNCKGIISIASNKVGITRQAVWNWIQKDPDFKEKYDSILDDQIDFVEDKLLQKIEDGSDTAIIFYLKCKGKKRGYVEKQEIDINNVSKSIKVNFGSPNEDEDTTLLND